MKNTGKTSGNSPIRKTHFLTENSFRDNLPKKNFDLTKLSFLTEKGLISQKTIDNFFWKKESEEEDNTKKILKKKLTPPPSLLNFGPYLKKKKKIQFSIT